MNKYILILVSNTIRSFFLLIIVLNFVCVNKGQEILTKETEILEAKDLLSKLGYWIESVDGNIDESTYYSVLAFQRVEGMRMTGRLTTAVLKRIRQSTPFISKVKGFFHIEVNISKKILFYVNSDGSVNRILPITSGSNKFYVQNGKNRRAKTPRGTFSIYRKIDDWRQTPLGNMYYPNYIKGGIAIHGSKRIPNYPVTYGCIAIPVYAAQQFSRQNDIGTKVIVY